MMRGRSVRPDAGGRRRIDLGQPPMQMRRALRGRDRDELRAILRGRRGTGEDPVAQGAQIKSAAADDQAGRPRAAISVIAARASAA